MSQSSTPYRGRVMRPLFLRVAPAVMAILTLLVLELGVAIEPRHATKMDLPRTRDARLVVIWIDSLGRRDLESEDRMPRLRARMTSGLHGPVRACNDAMTVPCFTAMQVGVDRFSLFSIFSNFGGTVGLEPHGILRVLQEDGVRLGYIGDPIIAPAAKGMDWWRPSADHDIARIDQGIQALDREDLDFLLIHLTGADEIAHRHGDSHPAYADMLRQLDQRIDALFAQLAPTDTVMVLGDHGHLDNGTHSPGLDVPTYAMVLGPMFDRPLYRPMVVTEYGAIWAAIYGFDFGHVEWLQEYTMHGRMPEPITSLPSAPAVPSELAWWSSLVATLLAFLCALPLRRGGFRQWFSYRYAASFSLIATAGFVAGAYYKDFRPYVHYKSALFDLGFALACGVIGAIFLLPALPRAKWHHRMFAGSLLVALPTMYSHGGPRVAIPALITLAAVGAAHALRARDGRAIALYSVLAAFAVGVWFPTVGNFVITSFPHHQLPLSLSLAGTLVLAVIALAMAAGVERARRIWMLWCGIGLALACLVPLSPPRLWLLPCVAVFPAIMLALWRPRYEPHAVALALPSLVFLHQGDVRFLLPAAGVLVCWTAWAHLARREDAQGTPGWVHGLMFAMLIWLGYWALSAVRANGYDFTYFFHWLGEGGDVEDTWYLNTPLTIIKYAVHSALGVLLYRRIAPRRFFARFERARDLMQIKLSVTLFTLVGFASAGTMGTFLAADVLQEGALWAVMILLFAWATPVAPVADDARARAA